MPSGCRFGIWGNDLLIPAVLQGRGDLEFQPRTSVFSLQNPKTSFSESGSESVQDGGHEHRFQGQTESQASAC